MNFGDVFRLVVDVFVSGLILQVAVIGLIVLAAFIAVLLEKKP